MNVENDAEPLRTVSRPAIREWIQQRGRRLEEAQSKGLLARTKLDLRDEFEVEVATVESREKLKFDQVFNEELDAFCSDMRLANVTVQTQIERKKSQYWGPIIVIALLAILGIVFIAALTTDQ